MFPPLSLYSIPHGTSRKVLLIGKPADTTFLIRTSLGVPSLSQSKPMPYGSLHASHIPSMFPAPEPCSPGSWPCHHTGSSVVPRLCKDKSRRVLAFTWNSLPKDIHKAWSLPSGFCSNVSLSERASLTIQHKITHAMCVYTHTLTHADSLSYLTLFSAPTSPALFSI